VSGNPYLSLLGVSLAAAGFSAVISTFQATVAQVYAGAIAAVTIALVNSVGNLSGFAGPYLLGSLNDITGSTGAGLLVMSGFFAVAAILTYLLIGWADRKTGGLEGNTPSAPKDAELTSMP
jgi:nitrate/nitrite transporter NarK